MAITKKYDAQIVVPCTIETKQDIEALGAQEKLSNADIIRRCIDTHLPKLIRESEATRDRKRTESHRLAG